MDSAMQPQHNMQITVYGLPGPQGSKSYMGNGVMIESSKKVKPWREAVVVAAMDTVKRRIMGPVSLVVTFVLPKPKSAKKKALPHKRPDLSKLVRSTEDALTDAGVWGDDGQVVECIARKIYAGEEIGTMKVPGAVIDIEPIEL